MKKTLPLCSILIFITNCSLSRRMFQGKPIETEIIGRDSASNKILIASNNSEYKQAIINQLKSFSEKLNKPQNNF